MNDSNSAIGKVLEASGNTKASSLGETVVSERSSSPEELHEIIAVAAYYLAQRRYFEPEHEIEDWLNAEAQILTERESFKGFPA
jgi:hypothetical protein